MPNKIQGSTAAKPVKKTSRAIRHAEWLKTLPAVPIYTETHNCLLATARAHNISPSRFTVYALEYFMEKLNAGELTWGPNTAAAADDVKAGGAA